MASWLDDLGLHELEHIKDGASAFAQELHPINSAEDFISFVVALNLYPPGTPLRAERIAGHRWLIAAAARIAFWRLVLRGLLRLSLVA